MIQINMFTINNFNFAADKSNERKTGEQVYFQGSKRNELNEIKNYLKTIVSDPEKAFYRKQIIKKVIAYTTSGVDTSRLYPELVLASATKDIVQKKLIYMYLSIYSSANENFARMAINTFMKDCSSPNPNIRSLAIRHISNLRFKGREEYVYPILIQGLADFSPLVKKSCIMGLTKLIIQKNRFLEQPVRDQSILNEFYSMIRQSDANLVCTAIEAINQIEVDGISMSKKLANYLLANVNHFGEFQLPVILKYLELYHPKTDDQIINILTVLQPKLKSSSASVSLAISKIYLKMLKLKPTLTTRIIDAIKSSLLSFLNNQMPQIQFVVLKHIEYIIDTLKVDNFVEEFKKFIVGGAEVTYLKKIKIRILELCVRSKNMADIINQFAQYLTQQNICKETIQSLSVILLKSNDTQSKFIIKTLISTIQSAPTNFLCNNSLPLIRNYLRKYPNDFAMFSNIFYTLVKHSNDDQSRVALIQIIGDYGEMIQDAIQMVAWSQNGVSDVVKVSLLRANVKLFFKRPHEMVNILTQMFKKVFSNDETHLQIRDYAAFLYRSLQSGVDQFKQCFMDCRVDTKVQDKTFQELEFNTLEIVYREKKGKWVLDGRKYFQVPEEEIEIQKIENLQQQRQQKKHHRQIHVNMDSKFHRLQADNFDITFILSAQQFQFSWQTYQIGSSITRIINDVQMLNQQNLQQLFKAWNITMMASADTQEEVKLYFYCKVIEVEGDLGIACMELCIHKLAETLTLIIKSDQQELAGFISRFIQEFLKLNQII